MMTATQTATRKETIQRLNDRLRIKGEGGKTILSRGVAVLPPDELVAVLRGVAGFAAFNPANDPCGEHDCAIFETSTRRVLWKVDYYDLDLQHLSADAADPEVTRRVLTIMLAEEY